MLLQFFYRTIELFFYCYLDVYNKISTNNAIPLKIYLTVSRRDKLSQDQKVLKPPSFYSFHFESLLILWYLLPDSVSDARIRF